MTLLQVNNDNHYIFLLIIYMTAEDDVDYTLGYSQSFDEKYPDTWGNDVCGQDGQRYGLVTKSSETET